jgi:hypothetical protein
VDEDVQPLPAGGGRRQEGVELAGIGDVGRLLKDPILWTEPGGGLLQGRGGPGADGEPAALAGKRLGDGEAEPAAGAGDDRDPVLETEVQLARLGPACRR